MLRRILGENKKMTDKKLESENGMGETEELSDAEKKKYQSVAAKLNFVAPDRPECLFATKECMRAMSDPKVEDVERLKRLLRYYKGRPRGKLKMQKEQGKPKIKVFVDADFAGCRRTRRSTCGGCIMWGSSMIKSWSKTLSTLALSSGESELAAMAKGAAEGLGLQAVLLDFGVETEVEIHSDATAAIGIASRQGLGRIRHIAVTDLWIQQRMKAGDLKAFKVDGLKNVSDLMTKPRDLPRMDLLMESIGVQVLGGAFDEPKDIEKNKKVAGSEGEY